MSSSAKAAELAHLEKLTKTSAATLRHLETLDRKFEGLEGMSGSVLEVLTAWDQVFQVLNDGTAEVADGQKHYELVGSAAGAAEKP